MTGYSVMSSNREKGKKKTTVIHFIHDFRSSETTQACKRGRSATVRLRCNPTQAAKDLITLPRYPVSAFDLKGAIKAQHLAQHVSVLQQIKVKKKRGRVEASERFDNPVKQSSVFFFSLQQLLGGNVRRLHLPLPVGEPARMSALHQKQLQGDCQRVHTGNPGSDAEHRYTSGVNVHGKWNILKKIK